MTRSSLSLKANPFVIAKFEKEFKKAYKEENDKPFKGNVIKYIIIEILNSGGTPNLCDIVPIIKALNNDCPEEQVYDIYSRWLEIDGNKERGMRGAFCDLCKDIALDWPLDTDFTQMLINMESVILEKEKANKAFEDSLNKLVSMLQNIGTKIDKDSINDNANVVENNTDNKQDTLK